MESTSNLVNINIYSSCHIDGSHVLHDSDTESNSEIFTLNSENENSCPLFSLIRKCAAEKDKKNADCYMWSKFIENLCDRITLKHDNMIFNLFTTWCIKQERDELDEHNAYDFLLDLYELFNDSMITQAKKRQRI